MNVRKRLERLEDNLPPAQLDEDELTPEEKRLVQEIKKAIREDMALAYMDEDQNCEQKQAESEKRLDALIKKSYELHQDR